jgi:tRNA pseudouridine38-40 synthase
MQAAADLLLGEHDCATFGKPPQGNNTVRVIMASQWTKRAAPYGFDLTYRIEATAFLQHMVRRVVGMLTDVGRGAQTVAEFEAAFREAKLAQAVTVAPPQGLTLEAVRYPASQ